MAAPGTLRVLLAGVAGYGAGLLPSATLAARLARGGGVDLHTSGSGNPGATNAASLLGPGWGVAVLVLDMGKGAAAAALGRALGGPAGGAAAGAASIAGHVFPAPSRFRGGKGVATSAGASLVLFPAYFPLDAAVAYLSATRTQDADRAIQISCTAWTVAALVWWRRGLPNAWGPPPTASLPAFAGLGSAVMLARLAVNRRAAGR
ncbi:glycerol-3-phosphate acyltransferase [Iamia majanohamensis]|uniref:Glycerol-3-phosphate acyltransferase n=1 Tax=Iamia majanohamensis TaxID=467976 RepID=A0AAF0BRX5_9ACTN|nr:glycerol-3-phosphate acyltransferase [Iamia majanohamensis]WCO67371.1 glycerol-3-phosphate acyltransferase [Iamia majanohamensis]